MRVNIHGRRVAVDAATRERVERRLGFALGRFGGRVGRVAVHLSAADAARGGVGKRCRVVAEVLGHGAVTVADDDRDLPALIDRTADRVGLAVGRRLDRARLADGLTPPDGPPPAPPPAPTHTPHRRPPMPTLRELMEKVLADGKVDGREVESLTSLLYADGRIDRAEAEFLIDLHRRVERVTPGFEKFFFQAIKRHVLTDGAIDREEAGWLRRMILADGAADEREKKLLRELKGEAARTCPEFDALFAECVK